MGGQTLVVSGAQLAKLQNEINAAFIERDEKYDVLVKRVSDLESAAYRTDSELMQKYEVAEKAEISEVPAADAQTGAETTPAVSTEQPAETDDAPLDFGESLAEVVK